MPAFENIRFQEIHEGDFIDFLEFRHHDHAKSLLKLIRRNLSSARMANPKHKHMLQDLICLVEQIEVQLTGLMRLESESLFPFVKKLLEVKKQKDPVRFLKVSLIESSISKILEEHNHVIALLHSIKKISHQFNPPDDAAEIMKLSFAGLKELNVLVVNQLNREQNFLFPKILRLEDEIMHKTSIAATGTGGKVYDE